MKKGTAHYEIESILSLANAGDIGVHVPDSTCLSRCETDEPVFVLCGRDPVAAEVIRDWADRREILQHRDRGRYPHGSPAWEKEGEKIASARLHATEMAAWHEAHIRGPVR